MLYVEAPEDEYGNIALPPAIFSGKTVRWLYTLPDGKEVDMGERILFDGPLEIVSRWKSTRWRLVPIPDSCGPARMISHEELLAMWKERGLFPPQGAPSST